MFVEQIQNHIRIYITAQLDTDTHTLTVRLITKIRDSINFFISYKLCDFLDQSCFVDHVWKFGHNNTVFTILHWFYICDCTNSDFSTSGAVSFVNSGRSKNHRSGWKIRTFYNTQKFFDICPTILYYFVVDNFYNSMNHLSQIVRRNVCCHTNSNTGCSVYQKIRIAGRKHRRLFLSLIEVWYKINGIFIDVCEHFHGNFTESCLCISHRSSTVTVDRTKVSMTINKRISCRPVLCHVDQCSVDGTVSMWMVFTHGITDNTRTFSVWFVRSII